MDYHVENIVKLNEDSKYKSLYSWSLQEFNKEGKQIGSDQISWPWSLYFTASELCYHNSIDINRVNESDGDKNEDGSRESESISAVLHPGICRDGKELEDYVFYSMFGTKRAIKKFELVIRKLENDNDKETCFTWGCVSYTTDIDFRNETTDDVVQVIIAFSPQRFNKLVELIKFKCVDMLRIRLGGVSGFYSDWSPGITAYSVKVLTASTYDEQKIIMQEGCKIEPPRMGPVGEFNMSVMLRNNLNPKLDLNGIDMDKLFEEADDYDEDKELPADKETLMLAQLARNETLLTKLRTPMWLIFIVLCFILLK